MRSRNAIFAAMLAMMPLGAEAADLVVWWEQGFYPEEDKAVRETIAAFEQKTGKQVELVFHPQAELPGKVQAAIEAGQPPDFLIRPPDRRQHRPVGLRRSAGGPHRGRRPAGEHVRSRSCSRRPCCSTAEHRAERALYALPFGRSTNHLHVWKSLLEQAGFTLEDIPKEWEAFWSFWCDQVQPAVRQATGREDIWGVGLVHVGRSPGDTWDQFTQFKYAYDAYWGASADGRSRVADPTARDTDPAARASLIKALDSYTAVYRKGCTPPDASGWSNTTSNNKAFLTQRVVMTPNETLSIMNALKGERARTTMTGTRRRSQWPNDAAGRQLVHLRRDLSRGGASRAARNPALAREFVRFLVEDGWLAHYLDFARERFLPPMTKLIDSPFWLDPSDPHRMASAIQAPDRSHTSRHGRPWAIGSRTTIWAKADPPRRCRGHQPRAGGRRGDRPDQADPERVAGPQPWWHVHPSSGCMGLRHCHKVRWCTRRAGAPRPIRSNSTPLTVGCPRAGEGRGGRTCVRPR